MKFEELLEFVALENKRLSDHHKIDGDKKLLAHTVKLSEEMGELSEEILEYLSLQGKHKAGKLEKDNLAKEVADVLIALLIIADTVEVDVKEGLRRTMEKINKRYE